MLECASMALKLLRGHKIQHFCCCEQTFGEQVYFYNNFMMPSYGTEICEIARFYVEEPFFLTCKDSQTDNCQRYDVNVTFSLLCCIY